MMRKGRYSWQVFMHNYIGTGWKSSCLLLEIFSEIWHLEIFSALWVTQRAVEITGDEVTN